MLTVIPKYQFGCLKALKFHTVLYMKHCVPKKVNPLIFDNNFGKCGPIFEIIFHQVIRKKVLFYVYT